MNGLKLEHFTLEYAFRKVQTNQEDLILKGTHQRLCYADDVVLGVSIERKSKYGSFSS
jgi:hypothetical protein